MHGTYSSDAARGEVAIEEWQVRNGLLRADVSQRALVRIVERTDPVRFGELLLQAFDLSTGLVLGMRTMRCFRRTGSVIVFRRMRLQHRDTLSESVPLGELREDARDIGTLLRGHLRGGSVRRRCAIANGEDAAVRTQHAHIIYSVERTSHKHAVILDNRKTYHPRQYHAYWFDAREALPLDRG